MNDPWPLVLAAGAGVAVGGVFFGGLWLTVRRVASSKRTALLFVISGLLRTALALSVIYGVGRGHPDRMLICLAGFILARFVVMRFTRGDSSKEDPACN